jgi:predicted secreted acid phosphatase
VTGSELMKAGWSMRGAGKLLVGLLVSIPILFGQTDSRPAISSLSSELENHQVVVDRLMRYHDSGEYDREIREVVDEARDYLGDRIKRASKGEKLAAVFDIDETALSNWEILAGCGFCNYAARLKLYPASQGTTIVPVLELFNYAKRNGVAVFFITGRQLAQRESTIKNLTDAGYSGWTDLMTQPDGNKQPARVFKSDDRKQIEDKGYIIVLNIGDQASDLTGCCEEQIFKLPNPFYLVN